MRSRESAPCGSTPLPAGRPSFFPTPSPLLQTRRTESRAGCVST
jgi:hypothetical protein